MSVSSCGMPLGVLRLLCAAGQTKGLLQADAIATPVVAKEDAAHPASPISIESPLDSFPRSRVDGGGPSTTLLALPLTRIPSKVDTPAFVGGESQEPATRKAPTLPPIRTYGKGAKGASLYIKRRHTTQEPYP
jgi:hypothetical protein